VALAKPISCENDNSDDTSDDKEELKKQRKELESYIEKKKSASVKAEKDDISLYFERVREHLIKQIEKEE
jgi:patatin-like phospholipase/acyl hydrolase